MSFETEEDRKKAREYFDRGLLYCVYRIAEELGYADERITASDAQKKNIIMDMLNSHVLTLPDADFDRFPENPSYEDFSRYVFDRYSEMADELGKNKPFYDIQIRYGRRTDVVRVMSPLHMNHKDDPSLYSAFAYMPAAGFNKSKDDPHHRYGVELYNMPRVIATGSFSYDVVYNSEQIAKDTFTYLRNSLTTIFNDLGKANEGITKDSKEFQELSSTVSRFMGDKLRQLEEHGEYGITTLKNLLDWNEGNGKKSLMDYCSAYINAKSKESGDLSSKQVLRLNACGRLQLFYEKLQELAWQETHYYPMEDEINRLGSDIRTLDDSIIRNTNIVNDCKKELASPKIWKKRKDELEAKSAESEKNLNEDKKIREEKYSSLTEKQKEFDTFVKNHPEHKRYYGFLGSDRYKDAIAGKLLIARLQGLETSVVKKALTDKAAYADLFTKVKESREFRENTALMSEKQLAALSKKSPSDILKVFSPKKISVVVDDAGFKRNMQEADNDFSLNKMDLFAITDFVRERSASLLKELKAADSTFHSSSHKKFEASLEQLHKKILDLGCSSNQLKKLTFDDLKDALLDTAFAAQTYQSLHQGKTISNGGLNKNIISRMAAASEIGIIYDYIASPDNTNKTFEGLMKDLCAFKVARDSLNEWISAPEFKANMAAYIKTGSNAGKAKDADTFAADLTNHKIFKEREAEAVKNNNSYKTKIINGKDPLELRKLFEDPNSPCLGKIELKDKQAENAMGLG